MSNAVVVKADDWEGLFINGKCVEQGHTLHQGEERITYFIELSLRYNFLLEEVTFKDCTEEYTYGYLEDNGNFPDNLDEVELE